MKIIDLEAHFYTQEYVKYLCARTDIPRIEVGERSNRRWMAPNFSAPLSFKLQEQLLDMGDGRIAEMDATGVSVQVLSLSVPGCEQFEASDGTAMARDTNEELSETMGGG